ncbi:acetolactate synthase large subunit [Clostridium sediminicola]|uniref:biosynthetic-type acetolactate synthase large subunit n=1 Tax=Clostridium sediminicola TaxID=3114879 RepID=UPI0031F2118E
MNGADAIVKCLEKENVTKIFGYPGVPVVPLYESLRKSSIEHVLVRQEQAAGHSASGFARTTRTTGVCLATSGPGATNLITAVATAYMDSIPLVVITGQIESNLIGKDIFQEADTVGATASFTKHNYIIKNANDIPRIFKEAFYIAGSGRKGPVLIDIPLDIQKKEINFEYPKEVNIRGYKPTVEGHKFQIKKALNRIKQSKKPLICIGGGIVLANAEKELAEFIDKSHIPVVHTLMAKDGVSSKSSYYMGLVGTHGNVHANRAVKEADLIILIGTRVADRATGGSKFAKNADLIHIDIDPAEIGKNLGTSIPLVGDSKSILHELNKNISILQTDTWIEEIISYKKESKNFNLEGYVSPKYALNLLSDMLEDDTIITADVGQNQIWTAHHFHIFGERRFLTSGGLGTMGYSIPAAIGAKMGNPNKRVISVCGDGGFQMSMFELGTILANDLDIIILLFENSILGMVNEYQNKIYGSTYGIDLQKNPDFIKLCQAYDIKGKKVYRNEDLKEVIEEAMNTKGSYIINCVVSKDQRTL